MTASFADYILILEITHILNFCLGFISSIGYYFLFYKPNRPAARWRSIALLAVAILGWPLYLLSQNNIVSAVINVTTLACCVLLGNNRLRMIVPAAFVFSIINIAEIPAVCFTCAAIQPLTDIRDLSGIVAGFPQLFPFGLSFNNVIITVCCLLAVRWLRKTPQKPPREILSLFSFVFIVISLIVLVWWIDVITVTAVSFLASGFLGVLLLGILLLLFYLYTRLSVSNDNLSAGKGEYVQFVPLLSKRELEVIEAVLSGNDSYKKLAANLNISVNTVKTHLKHIYQTTGVSNIHALTNLFSGYNQNHPKVTP